MAAPLTRLAGRRLTMFTNILGTTAMLVVPAMATDPVLVGAAIFLAGCGSSLWSVNARGIVQETVPADMVGRFYSTYRMISWSCLPVGALVSGVAARSAGLQNAFLVMALLAALQILPFALKFRPSSPVCT